MDMNDDFISTEEPQPTGSSNRNVIIIAVVAIVVLCCCCGILYAGWYFGDYVLDWLGISF
jgi:hypothetical protein